MLNNKSVVLNIYSLINNMALFVSSTLFIIITAMYMQFHANVAISFKCLNIVFYD